MTAEMQVASDGAPIKVDLSAFPDKGTALMALLNKLYVERYTLVMCIGLLHSALFV